MQKKIYDPKIFGKVAVICGGESFARRASIWSGEIICNALKERGIDAFFIDTTLHEDLLRYLIIEHFDRIFIVLDQDERRKFQAVFNSLNIPCTGCNIVGSGSYINGALAHAISHDEALVNACLNGMNGTFVVEKTVGSDLLKANNKNEVVKLAFTIESQLKDSLQWKHASSKKIKHDNSSFCKALSNNNFSSIHVGRDFSLFDYANKSESHDRYSYADSNYEEALEMEFQFLAEDEVYVVDSYGWQASDFMVNDESETSVKINSLFGIAVDSLIFMAAKQPDIDFKELCWLILETSCKDIAV